MRWSSTSLRLYVSWCWDEYLVLGPKPLSQKRMLALQYSHGQNLDEYRQIQGVIDFLQQAVRSSPTWHTREISKRLILFLILMLSSHLSCNIGLAWSFKTTHECNSLICVSQKRGIFWWDAGGGRKESFCIAWYHGGPGNACIAYWILLSFSLTENVFESNGPSCQRESPLLVSPTLFWAVAMTYDVQSHQHKEA